MIVENFAGFQLIPQILLLICTLSTVNLYLGFNRNKKDPFGRVINAFIIYVFFGAFLVWLLECFFVEYKWVEQLFPLIFLFGPFFYFVLRTSMGFNLSKTGIFFHSLPFLIFFLAFIIYICFKPHIDGKQYELFNDIKDHATVVSLGYYTLYGIFSNKNRQIGRTGGKRIFVLLVGVLLLFVTALLFAIMIPKNLVFENEPAFYLLRITIYSVMLIITLLVFGYQAVPLLNKSTDIEHASSLVLIPGNKESIPKYEKSVLSEFQLNTYEGILNDVMKSKALFLIQELSLNELALEMKIPAHHLTQVLNTRLQMTFHNYINHLRILHVCELMETNSGKEMTLEELGSLSGFNSKVSFNRHFKLWMKCTPSEYRKALI